MSVVPVAVENVLAHRSALLGIDLASELAGSGSWHGQNLSPEGGP